MICDQKRIVLLKTTTRLFRVRGACSVPFGICPNDGDTPAFLIRAKRTGGGNVIACCLLWRPEGWERVTFAKTRMDLKMILGFDSHARRQKTNLVCVDCLVTTAVSTHQIQTDSITLCPRCLAHRLIPDVD